MLRLTREQVREIDRRAIEDFHMPGVVLMENAARAVVDAAVEMLGDPHDGVVSIVCGGGNNGGDGLAVARHLSNRGIRLNVCMMVDPATLKGDARTNYLINCAMQTVNMWVYTTPMAGLLAPGSRVRLIVDAIFGTGLTRPPEGLFETAINQINDFGIPILAVDVPSGLDCDTGEPLGSACIRATRTVTFVAEKAGFANPASKQFTGEITVGCIGCPRELIEEVAKMSPT